MTEATSDSTAEALEALRTFGPMTRAELERVLRIDKRKAVRIVSRLTAVSKIGPNAGKRRAHVGDWTHEVEGRRNHLRPVYAAGDGEDKRRPPPKCPKKSKRECWERTKNRAARFGPGADLSAAWHSFTPTRAPSNP